MPKRVDKETKRREIAEQAMNLFAKKGFSNTAIREITETAGISKGSFYDYFTDKEDILNEIALQIFSEWEKQALSTLADIKDPLKKLECIFVQSASAVTNDFEKILFVYIDLWRLGAASDTYKDFMGTFRDFLQGARNYIEALLIEAMEKKLVKEDIDAEAIAASLIALIDGYWLHFMIYNRKFDLASISKSFYKNLIEGIKR